MTVYRAFLMVLCVLIFWPSWVVGLLVGAIKSTFTNGLIAWEDFLDWIDDKD